MRQIRYNLATNSLLFEFPAEWDPTSVTGVTLTIYNRAGTTLMSATSLTLYTATTLDEDADAFASEIVLASTAGDLTPGLPIFIVGVAGNETQRVKAFDTVTKTVTLEGILENDHDEGDALYGAYGTVTVDTSTTTTFEEGLLMTLLWTPTGSGTPITEAAQIAATELDITALERRFSRLYPRAYNSFKDPVDRLADMVWEAESQIRQELISTGLDIQRIVDQDAIAPAIMAKMAFLWTVNGDEEMTDERDFLSGEYEKHINIVKNLPLWADHDQDLIEEDGETTSHEPVFDRGW